MTPDPTPHLLFPTCADCRSIGIVVPDFLADLEQAVGHPCLRGFLLTHGGRQIAVPTRLPADASPAMRWLHQDIGWGRFMVPKGPARHSTRAQWTALQLFRQGQSLAAISVALDCHSRTVSAWKTRFTHLGLIGPHQPAPRPIRSSAP